MSGRRPSAALGDAVDVDPAVTDVLTRSPRGALFLTELRAWVPRTDPTDVDDGRVGRRAHKPAVMRRWMTHEPVHRSSQGVPVSSVPDPANLDLVLTINGKIWQQSNTSLTLVDIAEQIAALSELVTLRPGDLILTDSRAHGGRSGGPHIDDGDVMVSEIEGLGSLKSTLGGRQFKDVQ